MDITNALRKLIKSLADTKYRRREGLFVAEGVKCVSDTAGSFNCRYLVAKKFWIEENMELINRLGPQDIMEATGDDLRQMSSLSTPSPVIAVYCIPEQSELSLQTIAVTLKDRLVVALDRIQDPGNLGTIIRTCDWMGVTDIIASHDTVDIWSPKTVQATMGAIARVHVRYCNLPETLSNWRSPVYGTFLNAPSIYTADLSANGVIIFGNEGQGISDEVAKVVTHRLLIPSFPPERPTSESLNVATAAAITLSQFRSRQLRSRN